MKADDGAIVASKLKWPILVFSLVAVLLTLVSCQSHQAGDRAADYRPGDVQELLVTFRSRAENHWLPGGSGRTYHAGGNWSMPLQLQAQVKRLAKVFQLTRTDAWPIRSLDLDCVVFTVAAQRDLPALLARIKQHPGVVDAQPMNEFTLMASAKAIPDTTAAVESNGFYNDPHFGLQYGRYSEHITKLHQYTLGRDIKVAVVDTLADIDHPDLRGQIDRQYNYVNDAPSDGQHGTAVAGIIGARANNHTGLVGLAPEAGLFVYGACESRRVRAASCNSFNLAKALEQAIEDRMQVLNLSLAGPHDPLLEQLIRVAQSRNMIVIAAANSAAEKLNFPASMSGVVGVKASQRVGKFSHFSEWLTHAEKLSTQPGGGYQFFYGSSMSTASVSGLAALILHQTSAAEAESLLSALVSGDCAAAELYRNNEFINLLQASMGCSQAALVSRLPLNVAED